MLGKAASKSASLMKDMDELTKQARTLLAEIALPSFVCTHDHSQYLAMERDYYNKGRAVVYTSEAHLMQLRSALQQSQKQVEERNSVIVRSKVGLHRFEEILEENSLLNWRVKVFSPEFVGESKRKLEGYKKDFQEAQNSLKEIEQPIIQAEKVLARLMRTLSKHLAMDRYYFSKEGKIECGSAASLVTGSYSALQQNVEKARTDVLSAENGVKDFISYTVARGEFGDNFHEEASIKRSEVERCTQVYQKAQDSLKFEQEVDTEIDTETCNLLKCHGWYYCNREGTRQRNAAEVNREIIAMRSALQLCQELVEQARIDIRTAENEAGVLNMMALPDTLKFAILEMYNTDYQRYQDSLERFQDSLKVIEHCFESMQVDLDKFTHLKRPKLVPVEWRYYYRHRHIVLTDVTMNRPEIDLKMNTRLHHYFSKFRSFCFP